MNALDDYRQRLQESAQAAQRPRTFPSVPMPEVPDVQSHRAALSLAGALHTRIRRWPQLDGPQQADVRQRASRGLCAASAWLAGAETWAKLRGGQASRNLLAVLEAFRVAVEHADSLLASIETGDPCAVADAWRDAFAQGVDSGRHLTNLSNRPIPRMKR